MPPVQTRADVGAMRVQRRQPIRLHLAFRPRQAHLTVYRGFAFRHYELTPRQVMTWRVRGSGMAVLDVKAAAGTASYVIRLRSSGAA
jgi:hypothetical protein